MNEAQQKNHPDQREKIHGGAGHRDQGEAT